MLLILVTPVPTRLRARPRLDLLVLTPRACPASRVRGRLSCRRTLPRMGPASCSALATNAAPGPPHPAGPAFSSISHMATTPQSLEPPAGNSVPQSLMSILDPASSWVPKSASPPRVACPCPPAL
uniref:Uncharacterized protein n=1 Tax=Homo sapiens TaxID=9606 RepID=Q8NHH2_HUMAN|nr:unknown [Homo sapiens]